MLDEMYSQSASVNSRRENEYYEAISNVIISMYGAEKNSAIGDDLGKLNMASLMVIKFITMVAAETCTEFPNIEDVVRGNYLASKSLYAAYLSKTQI